MEVKGEGMRFATSQGVTIFPLAVSANLEFKILCQNEVVSKSKESQVFLGEGGSHAYQEK